MKTILVYFKDSYMMTTDAEVVANGQGFIVLDRTIFYPQGGGQPYDLGTIDGVNVQAVRWEDNEVRHYVQFDAAHLVGKRVELKLDVARRMLNMRLHTAGHLLSHAVEMLYPGVKAVKGHHYVDGAYVEFISECEVDLARVNHELEKLIKHDLGISTKDAQPRLVQIGDFPPQHCGGTHVKSLHELEKVTATKQKKKANILRISYSVLS